MKALSLWQPHASLMAENLKKIETRSWSTDYRGKLLICSTANTPRWAYEDATDNPILYRAMKQHALLPENRLPAGKILAVCDLVDCIKITEEFAGKLSALEFAAGYYAPRRFAWVTENIRKLKEPIPVKGRQQLFFVDIEEEALCLL
jgi:hypothetical protein